MANLGEHQPVLLADAVAGLCILPNGIYIDATFGQGGHSAQILAQLGTQGRLLAIDKDPYVATRAQHDFGHDPRLVFYRRSFAEIGEIAASTQLTGKVNGILLDLGLSTQQLEDATRGFSFLRDGPLDMRIDPTEGITAAQWLAGATESEIVHVLKEYAEERFARPIAKTIIQERQKDALVTTSRLANLISAANPHWEPHKHPATRAFQAIRIKINNELEELKQCLSQSLEVLALGGRLGVISFHSLEDRIVKHFIRRHSHLADELKDIPLLPSASQLRLKSLSRGIKPQPSEITRNPKARSATLRIAEKLG